ncbi:hypothetical protein BGW36DRAFT_395134 [Talaromyces proteolyticus]|uniref:DUF1275 domain protein n=1 Tax=Talaromyces proteolyticus TaxID=1131652 RepID=A0AAD4KYB0_9EURO|nr:uncharacterized protein BGW36DRAFT_395134 [Talaromyces proteolyticus]KAH8702511.1 hypothetical protein BGW36DRAFT_395134 [Talaromyces proteolyticus]
MTNNLNREEEPLLGRVAPTSTSKLLQKHLSNTIDTHGGDLLLLFCYLITGILDSSAVYMWGSFVSMQTGNTIYLGLGITGVGQMGRWEKSVVSIASFCLGSQAFAAWHRFFPARRRWVMCISFTIQTACIIVAAIIVILGPVENSRPFWLEYGPLAIVAFQSGGQAVISRVLSFNALTSVVLTSIYCDLFASPTLLSVRAFSRKEQLQRAGAILCLVTGAVCGGCLVRTSTGFVGALWVAAFLKGVTIVPLVFWKAEKSTIDEV